MEPYELWEDSESEDAPRQRPEYGPHNPHPLQTDVDTAKPLERRARNLRDAVYNADIIARSLYELKMNPALDFTRDPQLRLERLTQSIEFHILGLDEHWALLPRLILDMVPSLSSRSATNEWGSKRSVASAFKFLKQAFTSIHAKFQGEFKSNVRKRDAFIDAWDYSQGLNDHESKLYDAMRKFDQVLKDSPPELQELYRTALTNPDPGNVASES